MLDLMQLPAKRRALADDIDSRDLYFFNLNLNIANDKKLINCSQKRRLLLSGND